MAFIFRRRTALRSAGLLAAAHLVPELRRPAHAAEVFPQRLVIFFTHQGTLRREWMPTGTPSSYELGSLLAPLKPFKQDLVLLDGLKFKSAEYNPIDDPNVGHPVGQVHALTASVTTKAQSPGTIAIATGPSIDQAIIDGLKAKSGGKLPTAVDFHSFYMANGQPAPTFQMLGYSLFKDKKPIHPSKDPRTSFRSLFGGMVTNPSAMDDVATRKRKSILDFSIGEYGVVAKQVENERGKNARLKLDDHAQSLREIESALPKPGVQVPVSGIACSPGTEGEYGANPGSLSPWWEMLSKQMPKLAKLALQCDRTRFAHFQVEDSFTPGIHDWIHQMSDPSQYNRSIPYYVELATQFASLLKMMKEVKEGDHDMLYNSLVLWGGELAQGDHSMNDIKWVLAGNAGGKVKAGQWLKLGGDRSHADLHTAIAKAFGVNLATFGDPRANTSPINEILV